MWRESKQKTYSYMIWAEYGCTEILAYHVQYKSFWMFIVFWDTGSHIFQSDPNNNSDSTALFRTRTYIGSELQQSGPIFQIVIGLELLWNRVRFKLFGPDFRMFTGFWVIGSDFFQSDPNINSHPISLDVYRFLGYRVPYFPVGPEFPVKLSPKRLDLKIEMIWTADPRWSQLITRSKFDCF